MNIVVQTERENQAEIRKAWVGHAPELTKWAYRCLYARDSAYPAWVKEIDDWRCVHTDVTEDVFRSHFHGTTTIGTYTLGRDSKCLYVGWDIDHHDGDPGDPAANWWYARILCRWLARMGASPLLEDSNGSGGYHVWLRFGERISGSVAHSVAKWLVRHCPAGIHAEAFPKQPDLNETRRYGNQMRLPGKHHKRDHWSRFFDGETWLEGEDAVRHLLSWDATDISEFPRRAREYVQVAPSPAPTATGGGAEPVRPDQDQATTQARRYLAKVPGTQSGQGTARPRACRLTMFVVHGFALATKTAVEVLAEWGQRDDQTDEHGGYYPWSEKDIRDLVKWAEGETYSGVRGDKIRLTGHEVDAEIEAEVERWRVEKRQVAPETAPKPSRNGEATAESGREMAKEQQDRQAKTEAVKFEKWSMTKAIASTQTADWMIPGWCEFGCLHALTGLPFSGKSMTVTDIIAAMVRNVQWCGMDITQCPFILIDLENKERILVKRLERALEGDEGRMEELYMRVNPDDLPEVPVPMSYVVDCIEASGSPRGLLIIDTMRTAFQQDSNDEKEMLRLLTPLKLIARRTGWAILVLHHNAKYSNRYSGNTAFAGVLDYLWNWTREGYAAELSLDGRDDAVPPLCFEFDLDRQMNVYKGTKGESVADQKQEQSDMEICQVIKHMPDAPNGVTAAEVMALSGLKKWKCGDLLGKAVNGKYAVRVGLGDTRNPSTYYRTPTGKALVEQYAGRLLVGQ